MRSRFAWLAAGLLLVVSVGSQCPPVPSLTQTRVLTPGFQEPHTPGSGDAAEFAITPTVQAIVGATPDLNRVQTVRTRVDGAGPPRVVVILIPGFLGGAGNFDPLARDLVRVFGGALEVWAVDRRSNQLEDRRGGLHARAGAEAAADAAAIEQALGEGVRFYFEPVDIDGDGNPDGPFELPDATGGSSSFQRLDQDDLRFGAYWGVDTYARDWKTLVDEARAVVGDDGLVIFGGHSMGTTWTGVFAAYDFDTGPGVVSGHSLVDGLLLLEGGGAGPPSANAPDLATYLAAVDDLAAPGGDAIFLTNLFGLVDAVDLGAAGELNGVAATFLPHEPSILKKTPLFGSFPVSFLLGAPMTNQAILGFFLDDDFSTNAAFSASFGFSDNGFNVFNPFDPLLTGEFLVPDPNDQVNVRTWKRHDDPTLPTCPPNDPEPDTAGNLGVGCAIIDNGPKPAPGDPPARWGLEAEVTDVDVLARSLYETGNASEWYFVSGRPGLDLSFGRDSSALGDETLLNVTQNASMDAPVLAIGGSNGLTPTEDSFGGYFGSIATPPEDRTVVILEGYSHVDVTTASDNGAVPPIVDWINALQQRKLLESF